MMPMLVEWMLTDDRMMIMHQSFVSPAPLGPGIPGT